jgi:rod shape-determining protein MreD
MRAFFIVLLGWMLITLQTSVLWSLPGVPAFFIPIALYLGYSREVLRGAILAGLLGYLADVLGGGPRGLHAFFAILLSFLGSAASTRFVLRGAIVAGVVTLFATALAMLLELGLLSAFYRGFRQADLVLGDVLPTTIATALVAPAVFFLCEWIDRVGRKMREETGIPLR